MECVGDDIAWMRFDSYGRLRAINPEYGFFGVAPGRYAFVFFCGFHFRISYHFNGSEINQKALFIGTSMSTNPVGMASVQKDTIFTNTAETSTGKFYWEGMEKEIPGNVEITDWEGNKWSRGSGRPAAHPNSRLA